MIKIYFDNAAVFFEFEGYGWGRCCISVITSSI